MTFDRKTAIISNVNSEKFKRLHRMQNENKIPDMHSAKIETARGDARNRIAMIANLNILLTESGFPVSFRIFAFSFILCSSTASHSLGEQCILERSNLLHTVWASRQQKNDGQAALPGLGSLLPNGAEDMR